MPVPPVIHILRVWLPTPTAPGQGGAVRPQHEFDSWIAARGIAHASQARDEGFTTHGIRRALAAGRVVRVRRSWLAVPGHDLDLRRAAEVGGRITCLSAARRLGLWTPDHEELHVAVPSSASRLDPEGLHLHWSRGPTPVGRTALQDDILNVLFHVARCAPLPDALPVWESAIRTRQVDPHVLSRIEWHSDPARQISEIASALSDSGIETRFVHLMRSIGVRVRQQRMVDGHRLDGLIGDRLGIQIDGFAHHRSADRRRDIRQDARLALRGFTVLRFDYAQVLFEPEYVVATVSTAIAQGLHLARASDTSGRAASARQDKSPRQGL